MAQIHQGLSEWKKQRASIESQSIGFVPTMGALHEGHRALLRRCREANEVVVLSIFVNPAQFNEPKDLANYPNRLEADLHMAEEEGVDFVLLPDADELYHDAYNYRICEQIQSSQMEGTHRPGHFDGVLTVLMKLFQLVRPSHVYLGEKDYQQYLIVKGMVEAFFLDIAVVPVPTVRETSGLALSSRNLLLTDEARTHAANFHCTLRKDLPLETVEQELENQGFIVDYVEEMQGRRLAAVHYEGVRLIDNVDVASTL